MSKFKCVAGYCEHMVVSIFLDGLSRLLLEVVKFGLLLLLTFWLAIGIFQWWDQSMPPLFGSVSSSDDAGYSPKSYIDVKKPERHLSQKYKDNVEKLLSQQFSSAPSVSRTVKNPAVSIIRCKCGRHVENESFAQKPASANKSPANPMTASFGCFGPGTSSFENKHSTVREGSYMLNQYSDYKKGRNMQRNNGHFQCNMSDIPMNSLLNTEHCSGPEPSTNLLRNTPPYVRSSPQSYCALLPPVSSVAITNGSEQRAMPYQSSNQNESKDNFQNISSRIGCFQSKGLQTTTQGEETYDGKNVPAVYAYTSKASFLEVPPSKRVQEPCDGPDILTLYRGLQAPNIIQMKVYEIKNLGLNGNATASVRNMNLRSETCSEDPQKQSITCHCLEKSVDKTRIIIQNTPELALEFSKETPKTTLYGEQFPLCSDNTAHGTNQVESANPKQKSLPSEITVTNYIEPTQNSLQGPYEVSNSYAVLPNKMIRPNSIPVASNSFTIAKISSGPQAFNQQLSTIEKISSFSATEPIALNLTKFDVRHEPSGSLHKMSTMSKDVNGAKQEQEFNMDIPSTQETISKVDHVKPKDLQQEEPSKNSSKVCHCHSSKCKRRIQLY